MKTRQQAFTLIEVLAVVAVTLILAAIVLAHYAGISRSARNVVIHDFLQNCRTIYLKLNYGEAPAYITNPNTVHFQDFIAATTLGEVEAKTTATGLQVSGLPENLFRDHRTSLLLDYQHNTFDGDDSATFLAKVLW